MDKDQENIEFTWENRGATFHAATAQKEEAKAFITVFDVILGCIFNV